MLSFCTHCWREMDAKDEVCSHCGARPGADSRSFDQKLVGALQHPLPSVRARVCWVLSRRASTDSASWLRRAAREDLDLYVRLAAVSGLLALGGAEAAEALRELASDGNAAIARAAKSAIAQLPAGDQPSSARSS